MTNPISPEEQTFMEQVSQANALAIKTQPHLEAAYTACLTGSDPFRWNSLMNLLHPVIQNMRLGKAVPVLYSVGGKGLGFRLQKLPEGATFS